MPDDRDDNNVVSLPYGGDRNPSSGFAGSDTSRARAREADLSGLTGERQQRTITELHRAGERGLTWRDLAALTGWHHGTTSGVLSNLHRAGRIARLAERRQRSKVYVLPDQVGDRDVERPGRTQSPSLLAAAMKFIESIDENTLSVEDRTTRNRLLNRYARRSE
jgi:DNA-binding transcriptional regulator YhcF (GntR family)